MSGLARSNEVRVRYPLGEPGPLPRTGTRSCAAAPERAQPAPDRLSASHCPRQAALHITRLLKRGARGSAPHLTFADSFVHRVSRRFFPPRHACDRRQPVPEWQTQLTLIVRAAIYATFALHRLGLRFFTEDFCRKPADTWYRRFRRVRANAPCRHRAVIGSREVQKSLRRFARGSQPLLQADRSANGRSLRCVVSDALRCATSASFHLLRTGCLRLSLLRIAVVTQWVSLRLCRRTAQGLTFTTVGVNFLSPPGEGDS